MKLTINHRRQEDKQSELLKLSCRTTISRINNNINDVMYLIQQISRAYNLHYSETLGCICAHVSKHYRMSSLQKPQKDVVISRLLIDKFKLIFLPCNDKSRLDTHSCFSSFQDLVRYGVKCVLLNLDEGLLEPIKQDQKYMGVTIDIVSRLLRSLFLEFIPISYSSVMIEIYLSESQIQKETNQMNNSSSCESIDSIGAYKDIFQLFLSLTYHICFNKHIVNLDHFLQLLSKPFMGVVQWPMVIGARNHFDLPSPQ